MSPCNAYLMFTSRALIDSRIRCFSAWGEFFIKVIVSALMQICRVFIVSHSAFVSMSDNG